MKRITWGCDGCGKEAQGAMPPFGWVEASYYDKKAESYRRFAFCCYGCLIKWAEEQESRLAVAHAQNT